MIEAGTDEAGRGCLAGPVTAAAVILPKGFKNKKINDSKQLSEKNRMELREFILENAVSYGIAHVFPEEIDRINILKASITAMHRALDQLTSVPEFIAVDGNRFIPYNTVPHECIIKGDGKFLHIAAASILAKTSRDLYMCEIHREFPQYNWMQNKGYPTKEHRDAIRKHGDTEYHRKSFRLLPEQLSLEF
nr:ribonuclease HII [Robertkochia sp. 3YJGBD-33]